MEEININTPVELENILKSNNLNYGNIGVCSLHGSTTENCYIKLKKNQTIIINFFSNLMTLGIDDFEDNSVFMERKLIDPTIESKLVPEYYMWNILLKNIKECQYQKFNYSECLNRTINLLNKLNPQNKFGLFTGNDIDYNKTTNPILQRNTSIEYVPNIKLFRDKNNKDFAQYFYDYTQNKIYFFRTNLVNNSRYIMDLKELIEKYYGDNEFILFVTSCRSPLNEISEGQIQNGIIIDNNFDINNYLLSDKDRIKMEKNKNLVINFLENKLRHNQHEIKNLINSFNNKELETIVNFIKTNKLLDTIQFNKKNKLINKDIGNILYICKYMEFVRNYEYHINYALYEILHTNIIEIPNFKNSEINDHEKNIQAIVDFYDKILGLIILELKKIFNEYYVSNPENSNNSNAQDEYISKVFDVTAILIIISMEIISSYDKYVKENYENLYEHFPDMIKIIYSSIKNPKILGQNNSFTQYLKYFIDNQKKNLLERKEISTFAAINILLYDIKQIILDKENDLYDNIYIKNNLTERIKTNEIGEIFKIILIYMQKMIFLNDYLKKEKVKYIHFEKSTLDKILDFTFELIKLSAIRVYYSEMLFNKIIKKYGVNYLFIDHDNDEDPNIKYLSKKLNDINNKIQKLGYIKNAFNLKKLNINKQTAEYLKNNLSYDIKTNPCFLYEFVVMLRRKNLFVHNNCYERKDINHLIKWIVSNFSINNYF